MLRLALIVAHETEGGFVWWDEALMFLLPIALAILFLVLIARRGRDDRPDDD